MNQITRCPFCETKFKVVADQLLISEGWVRCGQCKQIFDATEHLQSVPRPSKPTVPAVPAPLADALLEAPPSVTTSISTSTSSQDTEEVVHRVESALLLPPPPLTQAPSEQPAHSIPEDPLPPEPKGYELPSAPLPELDLEWFDASELDFGSKSKPKPELKREPTPEPEPKTVPIPEAKPEPEPEPEPEPKPKPKPEPERKPEAKPALEPVPPVQPVLPAHSGVPQDPLGIEPFLSFTPTPASARTSSLPPERKEPYLLAEPVLGIMPIAAATVPPIVEKPRAQAQAKPDKTASSAKPPLPDKEELSFVRAARHKAFWSTTAVRVSLLVAGVLLLCSVALQVLVHQRNIIAATQPKWRPLLQTICIPLQCKVGPYRKIAFIVVENSAFNKIKGDEYQFAVTLKNRSTMALEMPAIELTLTDPNDEPVLRRVFTPEELQAPAELSAQGEWSTSLLARLSTGSSLLASGYRVLAFYP